MISSQYRRTGYLYNDNRASGGELLEADIKTCPHCQKILEIPKLQTEGDWCGQCGSPICIPCAKLMDASGGICLPFKKIIDQAIDQEARDRAYKRALGL